MQRIRVLDKIRVEPAERMGGKESVHRGMRICCHWHGRGPQHGLRLIGGLLREAHHLHRLTLDAISHWRLQ
ncbi:MAG: hypothetical protein AMJ93_04535 [Anaerolineae bacterium SM23_84]|nr:MAG: hypothetical protein AMJ93_04535 [Anaerolineae bacterium SM23_84]